MAKTLNMKGLGVDAKAIAEKMADGQTLPVARFYGRADKVTERASRSDPTRMDARFTGLFEGQNLVAKTRETSKTIELPAAVAAALAAAMNDDGGSHEFACEVAIRKSGKAVTFGVAVTVEPRAADMLSAIRRDATPQVAKTEKELVAKKA